MKQDPSTKKAVVRAFGLESGMVDPEAQRLDPLPMVASIYRTVLDDLTDALCRFLPDTTLTFVNAAYCKRLQLKFDDIVGKRWIDMLADDEKAAALERYTAITVQNPLLTYETATAVSTDDFRWHHWTVRGFFDAAGKLLGYQAVARDVTDLVVARHRLERQTRELTEFADALEMARTIAEEARDRFEEQVQQRTAELVIANEELNEALRYKDAFLATVRRQAFTDGLTGLYNRRALDEQIEAEHLKVSSTDDYGYALLLVDIDHFKSVNDTFGHGVGDDVLRQVAESIQAAVSPADFVARYGGEEIVVVLPGTALGAAFHAAERIRQAIHELNVAGIGFPARRITVSVGVSVCSQAADDRLAVMRRADKALYASKAQGRNQVHIGVGVEQQPADGLFSPGVVIVL